MPGDRQIKNHKHTGMKVYQIVDGSNRPIQIYEAHSGAAVGDPCFLTTITYYGSTQVIQTMLESESTWPVAAGI